MNYPKKETPKQLKKHGFKSDEEKGPEESEKETNEGMKVLKKNEYKSDKEGSYTMGQTKLIATDFDGYLPRDKIFR